jgi:hypothetical protein
MTYTKVHHFYHIWADGNWQSPLSEHISALKESEIVSILSSCNFGIVGNQKNREEVKKFLDKHSKFDAREEKFLEGKKINYTICNEVDFGFEQETMDKILDIDDEDALILYAHTKGSYNDTRFEHEWRQSMTNDLVNHWAECLYHLESHAAVGCHYTTLQENGPICSGAVVKKERGLFYGNFWWAHLRYLKAIGKPDRSLTTIKTSDGTEVLTYSRMDAEYYLLKLKEVVLDKRFSVFDKNPYFSNKHFNLHKDLTHSYLPLSFPSGHVAVDPITVGPTEWIKKNPIVDTSKVQEKATYENWVDQSWKNLTGQ